MSSMRPATTWRKPGLSTVSRRSVSASMMFTPALRSCDRWKQKVMSSWRVTRRERAATRALDRLEGDEVEPEAAQPHLEVDRVGGVEASGGNPALLVDGAVGEERHVRPLR